jgi:hypothetical protein
MPSDVPAAVHASVDLLTSLVWIGAIALIVIIVVVATNTRGR